MQALPGRRRDARGRRARGRGRCRCWPAARTRSGSPRSTAPAAVVVSGDEAAVGEIEQVLAARGVRTKRLRVSHAFHSPLMDPMLDEFRRVADAVAYREPAIPLVSA